MEGVDLHLDVTIGKHLSALARTLTTLTGAPDTADLAHNDYDSDDDGDNTDLHISQVSSSFLLLMIGYVTFTYYTLRAFNDIFKNFL